MWLTYCPKSDPRLAIGAATLRGARDTRRSGSRQRRSGGGRGPPSRSGSSVRPNRADYVGDERVDRALERCEIVGHGADRLRLLRILPRLDLPDAALRKALASAVERVDAFLQLCRIGRRARSHGPRIFRE